MGPTGRLVTIKRSGVDGPHFPLSLSTCLFGRGIECDIRIQLPVVSKQHCKIEISGQKATLFNFSATNPTQVNGSVIDEPVQLKHGDMITIVDRSFRYENESQTTEFPGQRREQVSPHQGTRSDFSSDPDGNVQDPNARSEVTEEGVSGPVGVGAAHGIPRASGEPGARKTPDVPSSALPGDDGKNAAGPTAGEFREDSSVTSVSGSGELTRPSTRCLEKCGENESPFRKLYESLKEELDVKSEKENVLQNRRRSGSRSHRTTDNGSAGGSQGAAQLRVSPKPGRRSGPRSQSEAGSASGDRGRGRTEARRTDAGPAQTPRDPVGPRVAPRELTKSESPAPCLQQNSSRPGPGGDRSRGGDSVSLGPQVSLGAGGGLSAPERILTRTQTQTATRDDGADKSRNTPEKALSKKRRSSVPVNADMLAVDTDTQAPAPLSPLRAQAERKVPDGPLSTPEPLDVSNSAEDVNKMEGVPSKRRRVSFGGHLRPELFDENLPPNTPLKRGETPTKRRSLGTHTPAVLKKIIKEQPLPSGKDDTSEIRLGTPAQNALPSLPARTPTGPAAAHTHGARPLPSGPPCAQGTDLPRSGGRRSSGRPPRPSVGRSQLELLQAIHSKRRSGASEANLIVAKSWADVVRLSAKQAQTKVAKRSAQRPPSKRQRRSNTPKVRTKPVGSVHHLSSTGHANSPCTIVIGKAHLEKVNAPARPCRMLNSFIFSRKADFNEDLSGLTEMFKTPAKEKVQMTSICPTTFSNSEDLLRKMFAVPSSEEETLLRTAKNSGETVSPSTRNAPEEPSEKSSINPAFRRQHLIVNGEMGRAPPEAEPLRPASSAHKLRRSAELGNARTPGAEGEHGVTEASAVEDTWGGRLGRTPSREQKPEGELKESARSFETCRKSNKSEENSEKAAAARRSRALEPRRVLRPEDPVALGRPHDTDPAGARGSHGPLRSPAHPKEPGDTESRTTTVGSQPLEPEPFRTPAQGNMQVKTPSQKVSVEVLSAQRKRLHTPGESTNMPREPEGDEKDVTACEDTPEQKRNPAEHAPGSRRRPRTPKRKVQALEDLAGFTELLQTPDPTLEPVTDDKTNNIPCRSPQVDPVITSTVMTRGLKTLLQKVDVEEALLALRKSPRAPGKTTCSPREPAGDEKVIEFFQATPEQKLDPAENAAGSRRRPRTPKRKVQHLEDLAGFRELFQTPKPLVEPVTDVKTKIPCKSPQAEPVITSTVMTGWLKTPPCKVDVDVEEALSALRKSPRIPRGTTCSPREPADDEKITKAFKATPEQKLELTENAARSKRRPRTPKRKVQSLGDLAGFRELFQSPDRTLEPMTDVKTKTPCKSPQAEPVTMPTGRKSRLKTSLGKVEMDEDISALRNPTPTPGETTRSHGEAGGDDKDISHLKQTPEQKVDPAENAARSKRRPRTPKRREQPLEELAGFTELLQTPDRTLEPVTDDKTQIPCRSPQVDPVITSTIVTKGLKTLLQKVDVEEALLALRKSPRAPGKTTCSPREPAGDEKVIEFFQATPEQKLDPAENAAGSRRIPRTPKRKVQHLEDLAGFRELFQTPKPLLFQSPDRTLEPVTDVKTKIPCRSPQAEPLITSTVMTRGLKTLLQKVDVEEALSALGKSPRAPGGTTYSPREPAGDEKITKAFKATPEQKLELTENVTGSRRRPRTPKGKAQALEDLAGIEELFRTPDRTVEPVTDDKTKILCRSPRGEPINTSTSRKSHLKTPLEKVDIEEEPLAPRKPTPTPGGTTHLPREPGDDKDIRAFKATPEQKLELTEIVIGNKRKPRTLKGKAQALEDLAGIEELFRTPDRTVAPVTDDKAQIPCKSPQAEPADTKKRLKAPPGKVDIEVEPSALKKPTRTSRKTTSSHREPKGDDEDIKLFKKTSEQKADSAENVTRSKRRPRAPKEMARAVGDLAGLVEPFQTSDHTDGPGTDDRAAKTLHQSSRPELGIRAASKKRQGKAAPTREEDVEEEEEPAAPRKSTRTSGKTTRSHRAAVGGNKKASVSQETVAQSLGPAGNAVGSRRRLRTRTEQPPPPEDRPGCQELIAAPGQDEAPGSDAESARRDPAPTRDKRKPAKTSRRVPRALSVEPTEDPARSPNGSVSRSPTRERGKDENLAGAKRLRTRTCPQDAAEDPPLQKRQRTAPRDRRPPPGPAVTDRGSQRLLAERTDLPSSTVSVKNKRQKAEVMAPPEKGMSLRSRRPNKTSGVEQGPGFTSAEKAPTRRNVKKTPNTSQEMKLRNLEDGAEDPAPGGQAQGGGARLRPGRQRRVPAGAAGEAGDSRAGIHGDAREEKEGAKRSGRGCLRPRKVAAPPAGDTLESEPKQRVTRSAKRSAESLTKENDNVCVRKMRTRSHWNNEDI
ncbi:proliferation marker protein Ki-67 isoform X2 [Pteropus medius]|uniref:proliferation marker protein Ki-67 isoform X2 n=1 Tax=Pteropus vampyrus TaxID=132908 RepID=UPI00196A570C|nr:proliferation marker protein Ki-67 isoform X2 [Pteropus giganteus]